MARRRKVSWEERVVQVLHMVRLRQQITEHDPVRGQGYPVQTRFCRYNLAYFDFDRESRPRRGPPLLAVPPSEYNLFEGSVNVVALRIPESDSGYPIRVSGTVLVRDQVDYKCVYLFRRGADDPQLITSPEDTLALTDPCRGLAVTDSMFFEIDLKMESESGDEQPVVLSRGVIEHNACRASDGGKFAAKSLPSWHSTVRLEYTPVPSAVVATLSARVLHGASGSFAGEVAVWTTGNATEIVLHDSRAARAGGGASTTTAAAAATELGPGGSVALSRRLVAVPVREDLVVRVRVELVGGDGGDAERFEFEGTLGHLDNRRTFCRGRYMMRVEAEWARNTTRENVYRYVGRRRQIKLLV